MSEWLPDDMDLLSEFEHEDPDGPEFDSEYDFDAESDSSDEGEVNE